MIQKETLGDYSSLVADFYAKGGTPTVGKTRNLGSKQLRKKPTKADEKRWAES